MPSICPNPECARTFRWAAHLKRHDCPYCGAVRCGLCDETGKVRCAFAEGTMNPATCPRCKGLGFYNPTFSATQQAAVRDLESSPAVRLMEQVA